MSVSTLPNRFTKERRLLFVGESLSDDVISQMEIPKDCLAVSCLSFTELIRGFGNHSQLPEAILINLNVIPINRLSPVLKKLKAHERLKYIPILGLKCDFSPSQRLKLIKLGFSDCFCSPLNWKSIEHRIKFLNKYQQKLDAPHFIEEPDLPYQMPLSKRIFDIVVASMILFVLSPFLLLIALLIKIESRGPVFYNSKRVGTGYQVFDFIKFRSMYVGADATLVKLADFNNYNSLTSKSESTVTFFKMKDDPRVTTIGKLIRKTSIDELPQLINVLRGEMSIVGNRPLPLYEAKKLTCDDWAKRFMAPSGLTGLWQVDERGKNNVSAEERIQLDMNYADSYSFWVDLKILQKTFPAMLQRE